MPKRAAAGGRPSKGNRVRMMTAVSPAVSEAVRREAEELDLTYSDVMANILAAHYGQPPLSASTSSGGQQMKLTA